MALEILGGRMITFVYGSSTYVWGSTIGIVLAALAAGYYYGGRIADIHPKREVFSLIVFVGGILVILLAFIEPYVTAFLYVQTQDAKYGSLAASILLLAPPTAVLGMASPFAVKLATRDSAKLGKVSGNLYSLSTIGSIVGALGATFILIPSFDVRTILYVLGLVLMLVGLFWLPRLTLLYTGITILLLLQPFTPQISQTLIHTSNVIYEKETPYARLDVVDAGQQLILYLNGLPQSGMDKADPTKLVFTYTQYFHLGPLANPVAQSVLFVGGGGFSGPKSFLATYPSIHVDVVEIDPDVIETAYRYFNLTTDARLTVHNEDARLYLSQTTNSYDLIVLDAYTKTYVPFHLMTWEFMQLLSSKLNPNGVVISNLIGSLVGDTSDIIRAEYKTIISVFPNIAVFATSSFSIGSVQNIMLVFARSDSPLLTERLSSPEVVDLAASLPAPPDYPDHMFQTTLPVEDVPLLTDHYAPVESLLNPVTGRPYVIEEQYGTLGPTLLGSGSTTAYSIALLSVIGIAWSIYLIRRRRTPQEV